MFTEIEQRTLDIDWFFTDGSNVGYAASGGGRLPPLVASSKEKLKFLYSYFQTLPEKSDVIVNPNLERSIDSHVYERYLSDFISMAKKGLFAFDKTVLDSFSNPYYHLVAKPHSPLSLNQLPENIIEILRGIIYNGDMEINLNINLIV